MADRLAGGAALTAIGAIFGPWLFMIGFVLVLITSMGFVFEYYVGINRSQAQTLSALDAMGEQATSPHKFLGD